MKKNFIIILLICTSCTFDRLDFIRVINYSDEGQVIYYSNADTMSNDKNAMSFTYFDKRKSDIYMDRDYVCKKSYTRILYLKQLFYKNTDGRVRYYFINDSVFMKYPWDTIVKHQMYNKKLTYTEAQLDSMDWIIEYR